MRNDNVVIITDGACSGNPGPGGWCAILQCAGKEKVLSGSSERTTNNRMELTAVVNGLKSLSYPCAVEIQTDSAYVAHNCRYLPGWISAGWLTNGRKPVANQDLWQELDDLMTIHTVRFSLVKGHSGHEMNERADAIAVSERRKFA